MKFLGGFFEISLCLKTKKVINPNGKARKANFSPLKDTASRSKSGSLFRGDWAEEMA